MHRDASIGVVVPAYNEGAFVGEVLDTMPAFVDQVYAVDDCSTDETWSEIQARARQPVTVGAATDGGLRTLDRVVPIRHEINRGRGAAVKTGYRHALEDGMDVVAVMDADGQMEPAELERLIEPVIAGRADYAKGNRLDDPAHWRGMSRWRLFGNVVLTLLTRIASGYGSMRDPQNGYTAISAATLASLDLDGLYDEYGFLNDVLVELNARDRRIADVSIPAVYGDEESGIRYSTFVPALSGLLLRGLLRRIVHKYVVEEPHPLVLLYGLGVAGTGLAVTRWVRRAIVRHETRSRNDLAALGWLSLGVATCLDWWTNEPLVVHPDRRDDE